jgi:DNA-binding response OmpR family regulator
MSTREQMTPEEIEHKVRERFSAVDAPSPREVERIVDLLTQWLAGSSRKYFMVSTIDQAIRQITGRNMGRERDDNIPKPISVAELAVLAEARRVLERINERTPSRNRFSAVPVALEGLEEIIENTHGNFPRMEES